jgi:hypothetical protein
MIKRGFMQSSVTRKGKRILREQETKLYQMHIILCLKTAKDALTPEEWGTLSFQEKTNRGREIK